MKGRKPTRNEKILLKKHKLNPSEWLVTKDFSEAIEIKNRETSEVRKVEKV